MSDKYMCNTCDEATDADSLEHDHEFVRDNLGYIVRQDYVKCPLCGSSDLDVIDAQWCFEQLGIFATHFQKWQGSFVTSRQAQTIGNRLAEIKTFLEEE